VTGRLRLSPEATSAELDGEAVILHLRDGRYYAVNGTGAALLRCLAREGGATADELCETLVAAHGIDRERARRDVHAWLETMRAKRLVADPADGAGGAAPTAERAR